MDQDWQTWVLSLVLVGGGTALLWWFLPRWDRFVARLGFKPRGYRDVDPDHEMDFDFD